MKVYVSEFPNICENCPCCGDCDYADYEPYAIRRPLKCPLKSLSDHTKQVRKEVCDEIRQNAISHNNLEVDMYYITPQQLYEIEQGETK